MAFIDPYDDLRPRLQPSPDGEPTVEIDGRLHELAPTRTRIAAGVADFVVFRLVLLGLSAFWAILGVLHGVRGDVLSGPPPAVVALYIACVALFCGVITWRGGGQSVGKRLLGLRVVEAGGGAPRLQTVLLRETLPRATPFVVLPLHVLPTPFDVVLLAVGIASVLYGSDAEQRRTWWDGLAGTVVILNDAVPLVVRPAGR